ncbi:hypothetical protein Syun_018057 [Stephania yunnanensis]|uniref:ACB domain-containing protein n=1 Tax=Stephania yunnanensis TaxID=152371 RepID=A0AAP0IS77_9MAGN
MIDGVMEVIFCCPEALIFNARSVYTIVFASKRKLRFTVFLPLLEEFEEHAEKAKTLPDSTSNENKLILYALYKQATVGPVNTSRPGIFNLRDRAKWDAWKAAEGKTQEEAMNDYITKVKQLLEEACISA